MFAYVFFDLYWVSSSGSREVNRRPKALCYAEEVAGEYIMSGRVITSLLVCASVAIRIRLTYLRHPVVYPMVVCRFVKRLRRRGNYTIQYLVVCASGLHYITLHYTTLYYVAVQRVIYIRRPHDVCMFIQRWRRYQKTSTRLGWTMPWASTD